MPRLGRDCFCRRDAPRVAGWVLPTCWRCTGMFLGVLAAWVCWSGQPLAMHVLAGLVTGLPAALDVAAQLVSRYRSCRATRLATGLLLGWSVVAWVSAALLVVRALSLHIPQIVP